MAQTLPPKTWLVPGLRAFHLPRLAWTAPLTSFGQTLIFVAAIRILVVGTATDMWAIV